MPEESAEVSSPIKSMVIDGVIASECIDSSGEIIKISGVDISSLTKDGTLNTEHTNPDSAKSDNPWSVVIGRCIEAKKIFSADDCENERHKMFWEKVKHPYIYAKFRLFDGAGHKAAGEAAAIIRDSLHAGEPPLINFSIEGSKIANEGNVITRCLARRVAATISPCNKTAVSGVVEDPSGPPLPKKKKDFLSELADDAKKFQDIEFQKLSGFQGSYDPVIEDNHREAVVSNFKKSMESLRKTLSAGSTAGAPGSLVGGSALQREDLGKRVINTMKAAVRDWDGSKPLKEVIKHKLPEVSDTFIDYFIDTVDNFRIKNHQLNKSLSVVKSNMSRLVKAEPATETMAFQGKEVKPGVVRVEKGPHKGKELKLLHVDDKHHYVHDGQALKKLRNALAGNAFRITQPHQVVNSGAVVAGSQHGLPHLHEHPDQQEIMEGLDLERIANPPKHYAPGSFQEKGQWTRGPKGHLTYVKEDELGHDPKHDPFSVSQRGAAFHVLARDVFGLGQHVPTTAAFKHPVTGEHHTVQKAVEGAEHFDDQNPEHVGSLLRLGHSGTLDKLALMDMMLGADDRHRLNYLMTPGQGPEIHLIDNNLSMPIDQQALNFKPHYWEKHGDLQHGPNADVPLHPEAVRWINSLDPNKLQTKFDGMGADKRASGEAIRRMMVLKQMAAQKGGTLSRNEAYSAPFSNVVGK